MLTADAILAADDLIFEVVSVPEWGGDVRVRGLTAEERDHYDREIIKIDKQGNTSLGRLENLRALLVVRCLVNDQGERLFRDSQAREIGRKSSAVVGRIYAVAAKLSGMRDEVVEEEAEDFDDAQPDGNSSVLL